MDEIKITLSIPGLADAINNLADAVRNGQATVKPVETPTANPTQNVEQTPKQTEAVNVPTNTSPQATVQTAPTEIPTAVPTSPINTPVYNLDQLSKAGAKLCEQGKMPMLIALLGEFGVQAITQLKDAPAETLNALAERLKALGAVL